ncbi:hypothetical protein R3P38DRAFT_2830473 [Favolaschia claudopus]|uniref:WW domain-containing protein n=1 Tax=Favolaschia claudopus TaxID=2862362 RepID=A0AAW0EDL6_9AGAR
MPRPPHLGLSLSAHCAMVSRSSTLVDDKSCVPQGWLLHVHPQGWVYFTNPSLRVVTDQDVRLQEVQEILEKVSQPPPNDVPEVEMHLQVAKELSSAAADSDGHGGALSLAINHAHCIASYNLEDVMQPDALRTDLRTLNRRQRLYWNFLWNHPSHKPLPLRAINDARDAIVWYITDNLISGQRSVVPFSKSECEDLAKVLSQLSEPCYDNSSARTVFVAWLLREVCSFRDSVHFGTYTHKQLDALRNESKHVSSSTSRPHPILLPLVNLVIRIFFFGIPLIYLSHVRKSSEYRGRLANIQQNWENYIQRLVREYAHFLLISTVLLSATVGFLSVGDIFQPAKTAAIVSTLASLGSIIVAVVAIWRHQASTRTADSFTYMYNAQHNYLGYHGHAILLSLPPVLLVWAVAAFTVSVLAYAAQDFDASNRSSVWTVFSLFLVFLFLVFIALYTFSSLWRFQRHSYSRSSIISIRSPGSLFARFRSKSRPNNVIGTV